ncbi:MAG: hypothetical protein ACOC45_07915 [Alkalispirochaetaceae bacterium]
MSDEHQKATTFISRLLQNPALQGYTVLQKEEQIIQFLHTNAAQLAPTLASPQFFPGKNWNQIFSILIKALFDTTDLELKRDIQAMLHDRFSFTFLSFLQQQQTQEAKVREQVADLIEELMTKSEARRTFTGAYAALKFNIADRYLTEVFARKKYIHFEMTKVQRLRMSKDEVKNYVDFTLLLRPSIALLSSGSQRQQERASGIVQGQFADKVFQTLKKQLSAVPEQALRSAVNSCISFNENRFIEATARLAAILAARAKNYQPHVRVDRGADTPDKSWFAISRRNYKFYGFDVKMLDELYKIAAENMW